MFCVLEANAVGCTCLAEPLLDDGQRVGGCPLEMVVDVYRAQVWELFGKASRSDDSAGLRPRIGVSNGGRRVDLPPGEYEIRVAVSSGAYVSDGALLDVTVPAFTAAPLAVDTDGHGPGTSTPSHSRAAIGEHGARRQPRDGELLPAPGATNVGEEGLLTTGGLRDRRPPPSSAERDLAWACCRTFGELARRTADVISSARQTLAGRRGPPKG